MEAEIERKLPEAGLDRRLGKQDLPALHARGAKTIYSQELPVV